MVDRLFKLVTSAISRRTTWAQVPGVRGAYISAGHNCWGILWGPVTGLLMSELLVDGKASTVNIVPFSPSRFMRKASSRGRRKGASDLVGEQW